MCQKKLYWVFSFIFIVGAALACQAFPGSRNTTDEPGRLLFQDDFSDPASGWNRIATTQGETDYADGVYRIFINEPNLDIWSFPGQDFNDVRIEVDALKVGGERNNRYGIICRAVKQDSFYTLIISSDGYYGIGKIQGQDYSLIGMEALQPSGAIMKGAALNHLRADCVGDTLTLYVNGEKIAEVRDPSFAAGDVGLIAGSYETAGTDIRFDNFVVYQP